jgi:putative DNA primase/helicase
MRPKQSVDLTAMTGPGPENGSAGLSDLTEDALALMFTSRHADLLYCHEWGKWLRWMDGRWANERTLAVFDLARALTREVSAPIRDQKLAARIRNAATVAAIVSLARADRAHARVPEDFDADAWTLNTPTGTVDLRTGTMRPHNSADLITKVTPVAPAEGESPLWKACLQTWTGGDPPRR